MKQAVWVICLLFCVGCSPGEEDVARAPETALSPELQRGQAVVQGTCIVCHGQGINGAPILGNRKMWAKRLPQGVDTLVSHAMNGYAMDMMPARGGNPDLTDDDVRAAVMYMVSQVEPLP